MTDKPDDMTQQVRVPVIEEELEIGKRRVETGRVSVRTVPREREELIEQALESVQVDVERVPVGREIDTAPDVREEGDTLVIPVVEERLVIQKRLFLREEIHVHRRRTTTEHRQTIKLRSQDVVVDRESSEDDRERTDTPREA
jgi:stress response protein YsnF